MVILAENKKAIFNYEILDKYEAGIELLGFEVKSVKNHHATLEGAFVLIRGGEAYLIGANIAPYQPKNTPKEYEPDKNRRLLLKKSEIRELAENGGNKALTILPLKMYNKGNKIKVEIATARGKKKYDKRESIKKREAEREIRRDIKEH